MRQALLAYYTEYIELLKSLGVAQVALQALVGLMCDKYILVL